MTFLHYLLMVLMFFTAFFLIILILIQRGKGGGLAGAFGGMGGQSAFGTKAGDLFTKITVGVAAFWIVLCIVGVRYLGTTEQILGEMGEGAANESTDDTGGTQGPAPEGDAGGGAAPESAPAPSESGK